ncbi:hypothetical protein [Streptomyces sp. TRM68416]|uniref:hypothetical protein n=1 Tax=Streptomyces sp. TRM68416 TaxID=2758412 RepID=UPI001661D7A8|nr:hypothetical protein [Streptomyces sp. TRM68416]MBD0842588.1 hypothetical protein [Streptomyces sp. TRM68416]
MAMGRVLRAGAVLLPALLAAGAVTGCAAAGPPAASASPSPRTTPPEELCTRLVAHWSREVLDGDTYGDYQSMGLSNGQYEILREVVDAARAERKRRGERAAEALIDRRARAGCVDWYRTGGPSNGPWQ